MQPEAHSIHTLLTNLPHSTGLVSSSIYDTAQVLRFQPTPESREAAVDWLLRQQDADGGWGTKTLTVARVVPTLACMLALRGGTTPDEALALEHASGFLSQLTADWPQGVPNELPVGMEVLLPALLNDLRQHDQWALDAHPFAPILALGQQRLKRLAGRRLIPGTPVLHSFEALGLPAETGFIDEVGSLSHSPAATANWLHCSNARGTGEPAQRIARERALAYLAQSTTGTPESAPGIYPGVWPLNRFEQSFVLYFFTLAGAFRDYAYAEQLKRCAHDLAQAISATGVGLSDYFAADGDDTAAAIIALIGADLPVCHSWLERFKTGERYYAYPGERHGSLSLIARAMHAAALLGDDVRATAAYLCSQQQPDGRWCHDKWHASWLYPTMHAIIALGYVDANDALARAGAAILAAQDGRGGWGCAEETAYALLSLVHVYPIAPSHQLLQALKAGRTQLLASAPAEAAGPPLWIGKELYKPIRIVQAVQLSALIAVETLIRETEFEVLC
jgi:hypothetical protein